MFTGIIETKGRVITLKKGRGGALLAVRVPSSWTAGRRGDSVAVNGCCLTIAACAKGRFKADLSHETLKVTTLRFLSPGDPVNLERPVRLDGRLGGHLVQGHIDGVGQVMELNKKDRFSEITIKFPKSLRRYLILKGSVAVDGISMTVNRLKDRDFTLCVIPETLQKTNLGPKKAGDRVNLEVDMVGKYIESLMKKYANF